MTISQNDRNAISTCLYTELAKCYFLLARYMAEEKYCEECLDELQFGQCQTCQESKS